MQLPTALPDESLFSRLCRHLTVSGILQDESLKRLLGDERAAIHPYLTANLYTVSQFTTETAFELLQHQTLRPLFSFYLPKYSTIIQDVKANSNELVRACQISTFREKVPMRIKHCPLCATEDIYKYGVAYWHCAHQIPGVEVCSKHALWLIHTELPNRAHVSANFLPIPTMCSKRGSSLAYEFVHYAENILQLIRAHKLAQYCPGKYHTELRERGLLTSAGRVRRLQLCKKLYEICTQLLPLNSNLLPKSPEDFSYFSSLLASGLNQHPFKHLLLNFYLSCCSTLTVKSPPSVVIESGLEERCCCLLREGRSMAQVGREIGKSRCYVKTVALRNNIPVNLRPKMITDDIKRSVVNMAYKGFNRNAIAKRFCISSGSVELLISTTNGLVEWRKHCKADSMRRRYKCQILRFINSNPNAHRQEIRARCEAAFYWLYVHEHSFLSAILPPPQSVVHANRVNWVQRDIELAQKVLKLVMSVEIPLTRTKMERILGVPGWLTSKKSRLPETMQVLAYCGWV